MYRRKDTFYERAKAAGYRSRAAYKLQELAGRYRLIRPGDHVVDLGAWPGGWLQVAAQLTGSSGLVLGIDLVAIEPLAEAWVTCIRGDVREAAVQEEILRLARGRVAVLLSDMAPKLTGVRATDEARMDELVESTLTVARRILKPGGRLLMKLFSVPDTRPLLTILRGLFREVKLTRPDSSRSGSAEMYVIAMGFRGGAGMSDNDAVGRGSNPD